MKVLLSLLALLWPLAAYAGSSTITTKDASGSTKTFVVTTDGSGQFIAQSVTCDGTAAAQCAAVKAASTASGATDPSLVVALSPNSPLVGFKDSGGTDMTDTTNHALKVNMVASTGAAAGSAPSTFSPIGAQTSGATGGLNQPLRQCDSHAKYDASSSGSTTMVTGVSGRKVYICGFILATGGTATNLKLREGSDANCASNAADLTPAYQLVANDRVGALSSFWTGLVVSTNAYYVCFNASAANAAQGELWYTIQ